MRWYLILTVLVTASCSRPEPELPKPSRKGPVPLAEARIREIIPVSNGGAYVTTYNSGVWYVRGVEAVKVRFDPPSSQSPVSELGRTLGLEIVPSIDGGAYAASSLDKTLWYLREGKASKVREVTTISTESYFSGGSDRFFALYVAQLKARRAAEEELEMAEEEPSSYEDEGAYEF